jgi:carbonic anhydrase
VTNVDDLVQRSQAFASSDFRTDLTINPHGHMMVVGCVDPRVDPTHVLGLAQGEAAVIRNVGGRITPATLRTMGMLSKVGQARQDGGPAQPWNLVILHHTDCGMLDLAALS